MQRIVIVGVVTLALCLMSAARADMAEPVPGSDQQEQKTELQAALEALQNNDAAGARRTLEALVASPKFATLSPQVQFAAQDLLAQADYQLGDCKSGFPLIKQATATQWADAGVWETRYICAVNLSEEQDGASSLMMLIQHWPASLADLDDDAILRTAQNATGVDRQTHAALLEALFASNWTPQNPFIIKDGMFQELATVRLAGGDIAGAQSVAGRISDVEALVDMRIDKRFDPIVQADPGHFDIPKTLDENLAVARAKSAAAPRKLEGIFVVARLLLITGHPDETLSLLDDAMARLKTSAAGGSSPFDDAGNTNWTEWVENDRSVALTRMGRFDEAIAQMSAAALEQEQGHPNVSQIINLGGAYDDAGQPAKALAAVAGLDASSTSSFGHMQLWGVRACAYAQLQDKTNLAAMLDYMKAHASDAAGTYADTLICAGDIDGAAAAYATQIEDPDTRVDALFRLQDFVQPEFTPPFAAEWHRRMIEMRTRPALAAAIAKYGRIESIPMSPIL